MHFLLFILLVIILFVFGGAVRLYLLLRNAKRRVSDFFGGSRAQNAAGARHGSATPRRRGKIITSDIGEYVDFEEIADDGTAYEHTQVKYTEESQIEDVSWEDLPPAR